MKFKIFLSILLCKLSCSILRTLGKGGTALPGKIALFICKDILRYVSSNVQTVIITGTNGKTTTSRIIEKAFSESGLSYFSNKSGANLLSGIVTVFCLNSDMKGHNKYKYAIIECDEAAFRLVAEYIDVKCVLVTNIFRDQLDRYGEITSTLNLITEGINKCKDVTVCINADCSLCSHIYSLTKKKILFFGVDTSIYQNIIKEPKDALFCIKCQKPYSFDYVTYGHLGGFRCDACGYHRMDPYIRVSKIISMDENSSDVQLFIGQNAYDVKVNLPGAHNVYNAVAAACVMKVFDIDENIIVRSLGSFECGFGRMEKMFLNGVATEIILVKNPAGFNQILNFLVNIHGEFVLAILLNDELADGTDVSWIYDVYFEKLLSYQDNMKAIYVSGNRAHDMQVRLKYAGLDMNNVFILKNTDKLFEKALSHGIPLYITPTYTAMFDLRKKIAKKYGIKEFYE
ncbi:MAG: MurT ligase domain-containing protein [Clostridia bacterium]